MVQGVFEDGDVVHLTVVTRQLEERFNGAFAGDPDVVAAQTGHLIAEGMGPLGGFVLKRPAGLHFVVEGIHRSGGQHCILPTTPVLVSETCLGFGPISIHQICPSLSGLQPYAPGDQRGSESPTNL